jgi:hypothetical protein
MEDYCKDCIGCKKSWSAGMDLSCHDSCEKFKRWKEGLIYRGHLETKRKDDARGTC